jgi:hypothetical protein
MRPPGDRHSGGCGAHGRRLSQPRAYLGDVGVDLIDRGHAASPKMRGRQSERAARRGRGAGSADGQARRYLARRDFHVSRCDGSPWWRHATAPGLQPARDACRVLIAAMHRPRRPLDRMNCREHSLSGPMHLGPARHPLHPPVPRSWQRPATTGDIVPSNARPSPTVPMPKSARTHGATGAVAHGSRSDVAVSVPPDWHIVTR